MGLLYRSINHVHERGQGVVEDLYGSGICAPSSPSSSVFRNSTNRTLRRTSTFNAVSSGISRCVMIRKWSTFGPWCTSSTARCVPVTPPSRRRCRAKVLRPRCPEGGYRGGSTISYLVLSSGHLSNCLRSNCQLPRGEQVPVLWVIPSRVVELENPQPNEELRALALELSL